MVQISDEYMREQRTRAGEYALVLLRAAAEYGKEGCDAIVWEHGRRNYSLRAEGLLPIVCPVIDDTDLCGIGIFNTTVERAREIMDDDPGVRAGVFSYEVHPVRSFPGDALPAPGPAVG